MKWEFLHLAVLNNSVFYLTPNGRIDLAPLVSELSRKYPSLVFEVVNPNQLLIKKMEKLALFGTYQVTHDIVDYICSLGWEPFGVSSGWYFKRST